MSAIECNETSMCETNPSRRRHDGCGRSRQDNPEAAVRNLSTTLRTGSHDPAAGEYAGHRRFASLRAVHTARRPFLRPGPHDCSHRDVL